MARRTGSSAQALAGIARHRLRHAADAGRKDPQERTPGNGRARGGIMSSGGVITEHKVTLYDIEVHYTRAGDGPPVVLVHGLAQDGRSWEPVQRGLTKVTTYAYDLRGHGRTTVGDAQGTLA